MKGFALILFCGVVAVQARSTYIEYEDSSTNSTVAALGENPWVMHLRIATSLSATLHTCGATLISTQWAVTSGSCTTNSRFMWASFGAVKAIEPSLVLENNLISTSPDAQIALINLYFTVHPTANYSPAKLTTSTDLSGGRLCVYNSNTFTGANERETLTCFSDVTNVDITTISPKDEGAGIVKDGAVYGLLAKTSGALATLSLSSYLPWIQATTQITPLEAAKV